MKPLVLLINWLPCLQWLTKHKLLTQNHPPSQPVAWRAACWGRPGSSTPAQSTGHFAAARRTTPGSGIRLPIHEGPCRKNNHGSRTYIKKINHLDEESWLEEAASRKLTICLCPYTWSFVATLMVNIHHILGTAICEWQKDLFRWKWWWWNNIKEWHKLCLTCYLFTPSKSPPIPT